MPRSRTLVLLALAGAAAAADDLGDDLRRVADLRVMAGLTDQFTFNGQDTDAGARIGGGFFLSFPDEFEGDVTGPLLGLELSRTTAERDSLKVTADEATLHAGFAYQTDFRPIHLEINALVGVGNGKVESAFGDDSGMAWEVGARFGIFWTLPFGLQLGGDIRWVNDNVYADLNGEREKAKLSGFMGGGSVGWRF
jgi:hypothetical protein